MFATLIFLKREREAYKMVHQNYSACKRVKEKRPCICAQFGFQHSRYFFQLVIT